MSVFEKTNFGQSGANLPSLSVMVAAASGVAVDWAAAVVSVLLFCVLVPPPHDAITRAKRGIIVVFFIY